MRLTPNKLTRRQLTNDTNGVDMRGLSGAMRLGLLPKEAAQWISWNVLPCCHPECSALLPTSAFSPANNCPISSAKKRWQSIKSSNPSPKARHLRLPWPDASIQYTVIHTSHRLDDTHETQRIWLAQKFAWIQTYDTVGRCRHSGSLTICGASA